MVMKLLKFTLQGGKEKMINSENIIPYIGINDIKLGDNLIAIRAFLKAHRIPFNQSIESNKGCLPEEPWTFIEFNDISLCFVKTILFEMTFMSPLSSKLPNGVHIGTTLSEAQNLDSTIQYNDEDEDFISDNGYWFETDPDSNQITSITIFLPEVNDDNFFEYSWVEKYI